ncbi:MAG: STAS domain-containing protein [Planctomycetales bacterium]|nr:STAS domain-containing protein [Planctomycetales bacterium]
MPKASPVEIRFHESRLVVSPPLKSINQRKLAGQFFSEVDAALAEACQYNARVVVVDLEQVTWISSVGLNELIRLQAQTRALGLALRFCSLSEAVREVFRITRLERTFELDSLPQERTGAIDESSPVGVDHSSASIVSV